MVLEVKEIGGVPGEELPSDWGGRASPGESDGDVLDLAGGAGPAVAEAPVVHELLTGLEQGATRCVRGRQRLVRVGPLPWYIERETRMQDTSRPIRIMKIKRPNFAKGQSGVDSLTGSQWQKRFSSNSSGGFQLEWAVLLLRYQ